MYAIQTKWIFGRSMRKYKQRLVVSVAISILFRSSECETVWTKYASNANNAHSFECSTDMDSCDAIICNVATICELSQHTQSKCTWQINTKPFWNLCLWLEWILCTFNECKRYVMPLLECNYACNINNVPLDTCVVASNVQWRCTNTSFKWDEALQAGY